MIEINIYLGVVIASFIGVIFLGIACNIEEYRTMRKNRLVFKFKDDIKRIC